MTCWFAVDTVVMVLAWLSGNPTLHFLLALTRVKVNVAVYVHFATD